MRLRILASGRLPDRWVERFAADHDLTYIEWDESQPPADEDQLVARLAGRQVLITEEDQVTAGVLRRSPDLAVVIDTRAAPVNVDVAAATELGVAVLNTPGRNADAVGDLTVMMMVMVARKVWPAMLAVRDGTWLRKGLLPSYLAHQGWELKGKTVGLIGLGATGRATARRLQGFSPRLIAHDPFVAASFAADLGVELVDLDGLLSGADFVSLHVPLVAETRGLIGARELALMKPTAFLVNSARAGLVDQAALLTVLGEQRIAGAALDVYPREPLPPDDPLLALPNVVALPHLGGATHEVTDHQSRIAWEALVAFLEGRPINVVNPAAVAAAQARLRAAGV
jgi:phosphoglycerate dehydrogenase-like enzyme